MRLVVLALDAPESLRSSLVVARSMVWCASYDLRSVLFDTVGQTRARVRVDRRKSCLDIIIILCWNGFERRGEYKNSVISRSRDCFMFVAGLFS